ncbi:RNA polymerase II holoenzyme cyclin-like subunit [Coemansia nantahalensis]|nr:RNA polymerase II holoenzyme cyclin-like subunit [Coemansia nantahalensis]
MVATCVLLACKAEEYPQHTKYIVNETKAVLTEVSPDIRFPYDLADIAECESYLLEEMKFYLVLHHPYQALIEYVFAGHAPSARALSGINKLMSIINDSYRTDMVFVYPPHVIAIASLFLSRVVDQGNRSDIEAQQWFADLNVDITDVLQVVNELLAVYEDWRDYAEAKMPDVVSRCIADIAASV